MNAHRPFRTGILALLVAAAGFLWLAAPTVARADGYAAIAYSKETAKYGYGYGFDTQGEAEEEALAQCGADDARVVIWSVNAWCALALGDDGAYGYAWGTTSGIARSIALQECRKHGDHAHIVCCVYSGD